MPRGRTSGWERAHEHAHEVPARATRTYGRAHERAHEVLARATKTNRRARKGRVTLMSVSDASRRGQGSQRATDERQALLELTLRWGFSQWGALHRFSRAESCRTPTAARPVLSVHDKY